MSRYTGKLVVNFLFNPILARCVLYCKCILMILERLPESKHEKSI